ncbi:MAG TPA: glycosyltransferase [Steroidobacteraceae bacterium]|nr:glycosyltransferase [Steroidobacteraceae bacterium]
MNIGLVVPGGVDPSGEYRVIPALLALMRRLARHHDLRVFALHQQEQPSRWELLGSPVWNIGARQTRTRAVRTICRQHQVRPLDLVHAIWSGTSGLVAVAAARILGIPSLVHVAGGELVALPEIGYGGRLSWKGRLREAVILRGATQVSAASGPMIASLAALGIRARRVPLGVDLEAWPPRAPVRRSAQQAARLIHVASLNRVKDQTTLLRALAALREWGLDFQMQMVGEDTLRGEIQALAERLGLLASVRFHGFLTQRALRPLLEAAHVMMLASRHEAGPLALLEAAVVGVPTVGTAVGEIADWAPQAALAAPVGDAARLAEHVARLLSDEDLRLRIAHEAWLRATREDADFTARSFESIYEELRVRA